MDLESTILYEDDALLVMNKPPGIVVNTSQTSGGLTVQEWFAARVGLPLPSGESPRLTSSPDHPYGTREEIFHSRSGIVHRLDKDTSGVLLLAKTASSLEALLAQFRERTTKKIYHALVHGKLVPPSGSIDLPLDRSPIDRQRFSIRVTGRPARTDYRSIEFFASLPKGVSEKKGKSYQGFSFVELQLHTGRTHQIRVHMSAIHHPVVSDQTYGGKKRQTADRSWCPRQFLHASSLEIIHPLTGKVLRCQAPLSDDLCAVLALFDRETLAATIEDSLSKTS